MEAEEVPLKKSPRLRFLTGVRPFGSSPLGALFAAGSGVVARAGAFALTFAGDFCFCFCFCFSAAAAAADDDAAAAAAAATAAVADALGLAGDLAAAEAVLITAVGFGDGVVITAAAAGACTAGDCGCAPPCARLRATSSFSFLACPEQKRQHATGRRKHMRARNAAPQESAKLKSS